MQTHVNKLIKNKLIIVDVKPPWGFRITLALKPHQEEVNEIDHFVWRFCINYIRLYQITRPMECHILRCDNTVMDGFGDVLLFALMDAYRLNEIMIGQLIAILSIIYATP